MDQDYAQRRRVAVAAAITVILVPSAFLLNRGGADAGTDEPITLDTIVGTVVIAGQPLGTIDSAVPGATSTTLPDRPSDTDAMGTAPVGFLEGTAPAAGDDPATIAIPRFGRSLTGTATFRRDIDSIRSCQVAGVDFDATITVTNRNNSRSVQCINDIGGVQPEAGVVVMHADAFIEIADLTDAPIPVVITW
ncbi:MAG: hypothetical protein ABIO83_08735 [Ilumatobacteraceae bacterium]